MWIVPVEMRCPGACEGVTMRYAVHIDTYGTIAAGAAEVNSPLEYKLQLNCWLGMCCANHCQFAVSPSPEGST